MVVISGDTKKTANLVRNSQNADILISNGLSFKLMGMASKTAAENNRPRIAKITQDVMDYQLDPRQAGEIAQAAAVKTLVFNHIVPPVENWFIKRMFLDGVDDIFKGKVIMGEDGMSFSLDPKTGS
jgi:ribonuclease Z